VDDLDRRGVATSRRLEQQQAGSPNPGTASSDSYMSGWRGQLDPSVATPQTESGVIIDYVPGTYAYRVSAGDRSTLWCGVGGSEGGFGATGVKPVTTYRIGDNIKFVRDPQTRGVGMIIGVEGSWMNPDPVQRPADGVWPFVRSGHVDAAHQFPIISSLDLGSHGTIPLGHVDMVDFSAGRPIDSCSGQWGVMAETGVGVMADSEHAYIRASEAAGVFCFYGDELTRVAGRNFQTFTSLEDTEQLDDEGELYGYSAKTVYPFENYGLFRYNQVTPVATAPAVENAGLAPGQGVAFNNPIFVQNGSGYAVREPEQYKQITAARIHDWSGYLGQGGKTLISAPVQLDWAYPDIAPLTGTTSARLVSSDNAPLGRVLVDNLGADPETTDFRVNPNQRNGTPLPGVFTDNKELTGGWTVSSQRHIIFSKRSVAPKPQPVLRPEDPYGDNAGTGYSPSGIQLGDETNPSSITHKVKGDFTYTLGARHRQLLLPDVVAYLFNWTALHPFIYHARDWTVAEEGAAGSDLVNQLKYDLRTLKTDQDLPLPTPKYMDIDHRFGKVPVYQNESIFGLLDDGSIIIEDGFGSSIKMVGGNIELHAAGDIRFFCGKNLVTWAGHDVSMKAHNSVDFAAVNGTLRTSAHQDSQHLAGNSGCGGFVFESKAMAPSLGYTRAGEKAVGSGFTVLCPDSAIQLMGQDTIVSLARPSLEGRIVLDAGDDNDVYIQCGKLIDRVATSHVQLINGAVNEHTGTYSLFGTTVTVNGAGFATTGWGIQAPAANITDRLTYLTTQFRPAVLNTVFQPPGWGHIEFSHRLDSEYLTSNFVFWKPKWHYLHSGTGDNALPKWQENRIFGLRSHTLTAPHPGPRWFASQNLAYAQPTLVDTTNGWIAVPRNGTSRTAYENYTPPTVSYTSLNTAYPVIVAAR